MMTARLRPVVVGAACALTVVAWVLWWRNGSRIVVEDTTYLLLAFTAVTVGEVWRTSLSTRPVAPLSTAAAIGLALAPIGAEQRHPRGGCGPRRRRGCHGPRHDLLHCHRSRMSASSTDRDRDSSGSCSVRWGSPRSDVHGCPFDRWVASAGRPAGWVGACAVRCEQPWGSSSNWRSRRTWSRRLSRCIPEGRLVDEDVLHQRAADSCPAMTHAGACWLWRRCLSAGRPPRSSPWSRRDAA